MLKIKIVGTSHISTKSHVLIRKAINEIKPQCIAIERPKKYLKIDELSFFPRIIVELSIIIQKIGEIKTKVGKKKDFSFAEMEGKRRKIKIINIDEDYTILFQELNKISIKEKISLFVRTISILLWFATTKNIKKLNQMPKDYKIEDNSYDNIIIKKRDKIMADNIKKISKKYKRIVVVVGLAHKKGIENHLNNKSLF